MEPFTIPDGNKFAVIALHGSNCRPDGDNVFHIDDSLSLAFQNHFKINEYWKEWLGEIFYGQIHDSDFFIIAKAPSNHLEALNQENEILLAEVRKLFFILVILGVRHKKAWEFSGSRHVEKYDVGELRQYESRYPIKKDELIISRSQVETIKKMFVNLNTVYEKQGQYQRMKAGMRVFFDAATHDAGEDQLHQYVRAIEGILKTWGRKDFSRRLSYCWGEGDDLRDTMIELFNYRSCIEHLNSQYNYDDMPRLAYLAQLIAKQLYLMILSDDKILDHFMDDETIELLWNKRPDEIKQIFGGLISWQKLAEQAQME